MSFAFGGTASDASHSNQGDPNHKYVMAAGREQIPPVCIPLSQWINCQETSPGSVEHIIERSVTEISRGMSYHNAIVPLVLSLLNHLSAWMLGRLEVVLLFKRHWQVIYEGSNFPSVRDGGRP
ncbi:hypothetical protein Vadar_021122 [Vaccinium darrowii]|uniref:Uncharacterized protein n=1 Tax=Vaccinium darrowii TaxID=229202 RepID=A0ACB7YXG5_9ERIC|nr:hypothetical protein Vadar_021122 [Vaccinium darrowii]